LPSGPRVDKYNALSVALSRLTDDDLRALLGERKPARGWGLSGAIDFFDGSPLFVKRVPVTDLEMRHLYSTRNLYAIPEYYCYGVGSAGFGVFREIAAHQKTTKWVLDGVCEGFPLMYHHRLLPLEEAWGGMRAEQQDEYVRYWGGSAGIDAYMSGRTAARHEAVIVLERLPHTLAPWLLDNQDRIDGVISGLLETITFLREQGIVHFDAHFSNVVTDGAACYLTDYGLLLDAEFDLSSQERTFLERHTDYDYGEALMSVAAELLWMFLRLPEEERASILRTLALDDSVPPFRHGRTFIARAEDLADLMQVDSALRDAIVRYRPVMLFMQDFLDALRANPRKDTSFDEQTLRRLLQEAGVVTSSAT
jgi:hypothetical protein